MKSGVNVIIKSEEILKERGVRLTLIPRIYLKTFIYKILEFIMSNKIITLKTFTHPTEAYPMMSKLEDEGIKCFLDGENTVSANPLLSNAVGGIKLKISETDIKKAMEIFNEIEKKQLTEEIDDDEYSIAKGFEKVETYCPKCESINIFRKKIQWNLTFFTILFLPIYLLLKLRATEHYCADCGYTWLR